MYFLPGDFEKGGIMTNDAFRNDLRKKLNKEENPRRFYRNTDRNPRIDEAKFDRY